MTVYGTKMNFINIRAAHLGVSGLYDSVQRALAVYDEHDNKFNDMCWSNPMNVVVGEGNSIKFDQDEVANQGAVFMSHLSNLIPDSRSEVTATVEFDAKINNAGAIGIMAGLGKSGNNIECMSCLKYDMASNTVLLFVEDNSGSPYAIQMYTSDGAGRDLLDSHALSGVPTNTRNTYTFILTMSKGTNEGLRFAVLINQKLKCKGDFQTDTAFKFLEDGLHPFVYTPGNAADYIELHGLRCVR